MEGPTPPQPPREQALTELKKAGFKPGQLADSKGEEQFTYKTGRGKERVVKTMTHQEIRQVMVDQALEDIVAQKFERQRTPSELKELCAEIGDEVTKIKEALKMGNREALQGILGREDLREQVDKVKTEYLGKAEARVAHQIDVSKGYSERGVLNYELRQRYKAAIDDVETKHPEIKTIVKEGTPKERIQKILESGLLLPNEDFQLRNRLVYDWGENSFTYKYPNNRFVETYTENLKKTWGLSRSLQEKSPQGQTSSGSEGAESTAEKSVQTPTLERVDEGVKAERYKEVLKAVEGLVPEGERGGIKQIAADILRDDLKHTYGKFHRLSLENPDSSVAFFIQGGSVESILDRILSQHDRKLMWRNRFEDKLRQKVKEIYEEAHSFEPRVKEANAIRDKIGKVFNPRPEYNQGVERRVEKAAESGLGSEDTRTAFDQQVKVRKDRLKQIREKLENDKNYDRVGATLGFGGEKVLKDGVLTPDDLWALEQSQELWMKGEEIEFKVDSPLKSNNFSLLGMIHEYENIKYELSDFVAKNKLEGIDPKDLEASLSLSGHVKFPKIPVYGAVRLKEQGKYSADTLETRQKLERALSEASEVARVTFSNHSWEEYVRRNAHQMLPRNLEESYRRSFANHPGSGMVVKLAEFAQNLHMEELKAFDRANVEQGRFVEGIGSSTNSTVLLSGDSYYLDQIMNAQVAAASAKFKATIAEMPLETRLAAVGFSDLPAEAAQGFVDNLSVLSEFVRKNAPGVNKLDTGFVAGPLPFLDHALRSTDQVFSTQLPTDGEFVIVDVKPQHQRSLDTVYTTAYLSARTAKIENGKVVVLTIGDGQIPTETEKEFVDDGKHLFLTVPEGLRAAA